MKTYCLGYGLLVFNFILLENEMCVEAIREKRNISQRRCHFYMLSLERHEGCQENLTAIGCVNKEVDRNRFILSVGHTTDPRHFGGETMIEMQSLPSQCTLLTKLQSGSNPN